MDLVITSKNKLTKAKINYSHLFKNIVEKRIKQLRGVKPAFHLMYSRARMVNISQQTSPFPSVLFQHI